MIIITIIIIIISLLLLLLLLLIKHHSRASAARQVKLCSFSKLSVTSPTSQLILQPFRRFTYVTAHYSNPSVASPTSQFILQLFFRFSYVTSSSLNSPGEPSMLSSLNFGLFGSELCVKLIMYRPTFKFYT